MRTEAILSSGGMDSYLLAYYLRARTPIHIFVDVGQKYAAKELEAAMRVARVIGADFKKLNGPDLSQYEHPSGIIPFRNAQLILTAAQHAEVIYLGVIAHEINSDKSPEFMHAMKDVLDISHAPQYWTKGRTFNIFAPLRDKTKTELVRDYLCEPGAAVLDLLQTVSCYSGGDGHCGRCASCFKRWVALQNNGVTGQRFASNPITWKSPEEWRAALAGYHPARAEEVRTALASVGVHV